MYICVRICFVYILNCVSDTKFSSFYNFSNIVSFSPSKYVWCILIFKFLCPACLPHPALKMQTRSIILYFSLNFVATYVYICLPFLSLFVSSNLLNDAMILHQYFTCTSVIVYSRWLNFTSQRSFSHVHI